MIKWFVVLMLIVVVGVSLYMKNSYIPVTILKTAVKKSDLRGKSYILCQHEMVTGFDWIVIKNEFGKRTNEYCNIIGADPFGELNLRYEFVMADNVFVFYITEKRKYYCEKMNMNMLEYVVTGWDILYPVKRGELSDLFRRSKHITEDDVRKYRQRER
jgi:hypothetical protein